MDSREIGTERVREPDRVGHERGFPRQPVPGRDAGNVVHQEEFAAEHARIGAQETRCRHECTE